MYQSIPMLRPTPWRCCLPWSAAFSLLWFRFVKCCAPIPGRSSAQDRQVSAVCADLVTASLVAVRGLARSLHSNYGFQPQGAILLKTDLHMGGYDDDQRPQM